jgi:hypothetical protein
MSLLIIYCDCLVTRILPNFETNQRTSLPSMKQLVYLWNRRIYMCSSDMRMDHYLMNNVGTIAEQSMPIL